jgi:hemerythrin
MPIVTWSEDFSVSIQEIDDQHKVIVDLINKINDAVTGNGSAEAIGQVIEELVRYTTVHFAIEEALMRMFHYPDYAQHKQIHTKLLERVLNFQKQYAKGNTQIGSELLYFLRDWLLSHIVKVDRGYSAHLLSHKIEG